MFKPGAKGLFSPIAELIDNPNISEILINKPQEIFYEINQTMHRLHIEAYRSKTLLQLFLLIAHENNQTINDQNPLLSGTLSSGHRVQLVLPPVSLFPTLSIRKQTRKNLSLSEYSKMHFYELAAQNDVNVSVISSSECSLGHLYRCKRWHDFVAEAIKQKKNMVISGGTSTGKTAYLNACLNQIPHHERMIILEDTREIDIPHPNQVRLLAIKDKTRHVNISLQELLQVSLRLRPDRIICGEIRGKEILEFIAACSTGHEGSMTTIHANNPKSAFMRMTQMYKLNNVPFMTDEAIHKELHQVIDIIVQLTKDESGRRVDAIYFKDESSIL